MEKKPEPGMRRVYATCSDPKELLLLAQLFQVSGVEAVQSGWEDIPFPNWPCYRDTLKLLDDSLQAVAPPRALGRMEVLPLGEEVDIMFQRNRLHLSSKKR
jgi:hypothetical protein